MRYRVHRHGYHAADSHIQESLFFSILYAKRLVIRRFLEGLFGD